MPIGAGAPPLPEECTLAYEHVDPAEAVARWRQVGAVCVGVGRMQGAGLRLDPDDAYRPGDARDALSERACQLGAQMVTPTGFCPLGKYTGVEFGAYVAR